MRSTGPLAATSLTCLILACGDAAAPPVPDSYRLRPALLTTVTGAADSLEVWAFDGNAGWRTSATHWTVLDPGILSVDAAGKTLGLAPGWTSVRAAVGDTVLEAEVAVGVAFRALTSADSHTCGLDANGAAHCWGGDGDPEPLLGAGRVGRSRVPVAVAGGLGFRALSAGEEATCGITTADALYCWGFDDRGQLGAGSDLTEWCSGRLCATVPRRVMGGATYRMVSAGWGGQSCAIRSDASWVCWGRDVGSPYAPSALCKSTGENQGCRIPTPVAAGRWQVVATGYQHACALDESGAAWCLGRGPNGQLGSAPDAGCGWICATEPVRVPGIPALDTLVANAHFTCGLSAPDRTSIYCWGTSDRFPGSTSASPPAAAPFRVAREAAVSLGTWASDVCAVSAGGAADCWGSDVAPMGPGLPEALPVAVPVSMVSAGNGSGCVLTANGGALCGYAWLTPLPPPGERPRQEGR